MKCMKSELLAILPQRFRPELRDELVPDLMEVRLRLGQPGKLICTGGLVPTKQTVTAEDLRFCVNAVSRYSPWNASTIKDGYLTAPGGHRIGLCGEAAGEGLRNVTSLCIRVAKELPGIGDSLPIRDSTLIIGPPGSGKTTLLRDLIRKISCREREAISVVDERCEIFPLANGQPCFDPGPNTDVLSGKGKTSGIDMVLRSMGPGWIAVDEITAESDCAALIRAGWCGVKLLATAHASTLSDLRSREIYRPLLEKGLFHSVVVLTPDKSRRLERI